MQKVQLASPVGGLVYYLGEVEAAAGPASGRCVLAHLSQCEAFDKVHVAVDRHQAISSLLAVVLG